MYRQTIQIRVDILLEKNTGQRIMQWHHKRIERKKKSANPEFCTEQKYLLEVKVEWRHFQTSRSWGNLSDKNRGICYRESFRLGGSNPRCKLGSAKRSEEPWYVGKQKRLFFLSFLDTQCLWIQVITHFLIFLWI